MVIGIIIFRQIYKNHLVISGVVNQADVDRLMEAGADDFIKKPFNIENVVERLVSLAKV